jgi:hypothetical protein
VRDVPESEQVELVASLLEAIGAEAESEEGLRVCSNFRTAGLLRPVDGEVIDICKAMDAAGTVKAKVAKFGNESLVKEIGVELLGKGL